MAVRRYHHGNLRKVLIEAGLKLIAKKGVDALTLREIGARVGVSRMAPYRHFTDKQDLLKAIRKAGFDQFAEALEAARSDPRLPFFERLQGMALAYVRFAAEYPAHYEVMFGSSFRPAGREESGDRAFSILVETVREGQELGEIKDGDPVMFANALWAQVHGISTLGIETDLSEDGAGTKFVEFCTEALRTGIARINKDSRAGT
jgi:AcrR family transcriptional regulator